MAKAARILNVKARIEKQFRTIIDQAEKESDDKTWHRYNVVTRFEKWAKDDPLVSEAMLRRFAENEFTSFDRHHRPNFKPDKSAPKLPFNYHTARDQFIPIGKTEDGPQRVRFSEAQQIHLEAFTKILTHNFKSVRDKYVIDNRTLKKMIRAMKGDRALKTTDDVMRKVYGWKPAAPDKDDEALSA